MKQLLRIGAVVAILMIESMATAQNHDPKFNVHFTVQTSGFDGNRCWAWVHDDKASYYIQPLGLFHCWEPSPNAELYGKFRRNGMGRTTIVFENAQTDQKSGKAKNEEVLVVQWVDLNRSTASSTPASTPTQNAAPAEVAIVQVNSEPPGADIVVDDSYAGSTPSQVKLKPGTRSIKIVKKGYAPWVRSMSVEAGESKSIFAELDKQSQ
jgi:hypothetical protein